MGIRLRIRRLGGGVCAAIVVVASTILAAGCGADAPFVELTSEETADAVPKIRLRAKELQERFRKAPHATNRELGGAVVQLDGQVLGVGRHGADRWWLLLAGGPKSVRPIQCFMQIGRPWKQVLPGMVVSVKGQVERIAPGATPQLRESLILSVDELLVPGVKISAEDLCRRYQADHVLAQNEFLEQWVWLTGTITSVDAVNQLLFLDGGGAMRVQCVPIDRERGWDEPLREGEQVLLAGRITDGDGRRVVVRECLSPEVLATAED